MKPANPDHVSNKVNKRARNVKLMALRLFTTAKQAKQKKTRAEENKNKQANNAGVVFIST